MGRLQIQRLDSIGAIRCRAAAWDRLWQRSEVSLPTARAELTAQWLEHFARKAPFCVLTVEEDGDLVGVLPLAGRKVRRVLPVADLTGNYWSFNGELLLDPQADRPAICDHFAEAIASLPWPLLWVETIPIERAHWQEMRAALARRKLAVDVHARYRIGQVDLRGSFADYDGNLSKNHRRSLRKDLHRLEREGPTEFHLHSEFTAEEVPAALDRVFQLETATWKAAADGCVARVAGLPQFYIRQCQQLAQWGCLRLASLGHRGSLVAFELGWTAKGIFHSIRVGYRQDYRPYGPGHLLRRWLIEKLFQEGDVQTIDFQGPMTDALAQWSTSSYQVGRLVAVPSRLSSRAIWIAYRALAPVLRRLRRQSCDPAPIQNPESFMTAPRAVVFDMDGLMFNTEDVYWQVGTELLRRRGRCFSRELSDAMMGRPPQTCFDVMIRWHSLKETWQELAAESEEIFLGLLDQYLAPMPGLMELLAALEKAGIGKAIGTSSSRRSLEAILSRFALQPRFQFTLTAEDITHGKPDPEIYLQAASRFGVAPRDMLVLEDSQTGCRSASAAGAIVVAVPGAHSMSQDFSAAGLVLRSLADRRLYALLELPAV